MNKGLLAIIAASVLGLSKSSKGSQARAVFESKKAKDRFKDLNGYEMDSLVDLMLDAYIHVFMNLEGFYDHLEQNNIEYKDRPYFVTPMITTNIGIDGNLLDNIGIKYKEVKMRHVQPDWYHAYGIIVKNLMGMDTFITPMIQENIGNKESINLKADEKKNKRIEEWLESEDLGLETRKMDTHAEFINGSFSLNHFFSEIRTSFHINILSRNRYGFSAGFELLKKPLYLRVKSLLESNKRAMDIFKYGVRISLKHELIHVIEIGDNWRVVYDKVHGMKNYMSSRAERRTWGQNVVDEVNFHLDTLNESEELFPEETTDMFYSPYREMKFKFNQVFLEDVAKLLSFRQLIDNDILVKKTLKWINLPQNEEKFSDVHVRNDFILKTFPILKEKTFQHWMKMVAKSIKDKSSGTISIIGGKGDNPEAYKQCLKRFFNRCSKDGEIKPIIYVFTGASEQKDAGLLEASAFKEMGADVEVIHNAFDFMQKLSPIDFQGIFFTDGDQSRLMKRIGSPDYKRMIKEANEKGVHIGGTSAGAAVLSEKIIIGGENEPVIADGLGLIKKYIVDQHFSSKNRKERLQRSIKSTGLRGLGVDEDTIIIVFDDGYSEIYGGKNVFILFFDDENGFYEVALADDEATMYGLIF